MNTLIYNPNCWHYLKGNFFYRVHRWLRKFFPVAKEIREQLNQAVFQAYDLLLTQNHEQNQRKAEMPTSDQMPEQNTGIQMAGL